MVSIRLKVVSIGFISPSPLILGYTIFKQGRACLSSILKSLSKTFVKFNLIETKLKKTFRKSLGLF